MSSVTKTAEKPAVKTQKKAKKQSQWVDVWRRLRKNKLAMIGMVIVIVMLLSALLADFIAPYDYAKQNYSQRFVFPNGEHLFGTDDFGRDIFSRVLKGGQMSLGVSIVSVALAVVAGGLLGSTAAYYGGFYGAVVMRCIDVIQAMPSFLLAMAVAAALGTGMTNTCIAIAIGTIPTFTRILYASVLSIKGQEYIESAIACGASNFRIILKHIIPNCLAPIIVNVTLRIGVAIMTISGLSFIGLGVQPPTPEWGSIISAGRQYIRDFWPIVVMPGIAIALTMIGFNLFGDGLRDALDPKLKN